MEYKPGDVVNGHVLGEDNQWHPLPTGWAAPGQAPGEPAARAWGQQPGQPGPGQWGQQPGQQPPQQGWQQWGQPAGHPPGPPKPSGPIYKRWWFWVAAGLLVVVVGVVAVAALAIRAAVDSVSATTTSRTTATRTTATPRTTTPPTATSTATSTVTSGGQIGQAFTDATLELTVTSVECGATDVGGALTRAQAIGQYCLVYVKVTNLGTDEDSLLGPLQKAVDNQGREFRPDTAAHIRMGSKDTLASEIPPGQSVTGPLVFDVPAGASLRSVVLRADFLSPGVTVALA